MSVVYIYIYIYLHHMSQYILAVCAQLKHLIEAFFKVLFTMGHFHNNSNHAMCTIKAIFFEGIMFLRVLKENFFNIN